MATLSKSQFIEHLLWSQSLCLGILHASGSPREFLSYATQVIPLRKAQSHTSGKQAGFIAKA